MPEGQTQQAERSTRLQSAQAMARTQAIREEEPDDIVGAPLWNMPAAVRQNDTAPQPIGLERALNEEESLSAKERLNAERARAQTSQASLGPDPSVTRFAENGNIDDATYQNSLNEMQQLTQQMRTTQTLAQAQGIAARYRALNDNLIESALSDEQRKGLNEFRNQIWRSIRNGGPLIDDLCGGWDVGFFTFLSDAIGVWQFAKGVKYRGSEEPLNFMALLTPPPYDLKVTTSEGGKLIRRILFWAFDIVGFIWSWGQTGLVVGLIAFSAIFLTLFTECTTSTITATFDPMCQSLAKELGVAVSDLSSVFAGAGTGTSTTKSVNPVNQ